jgi:hypothetical protein
MLRRFALLWLIGLSLALRFDACAARDGEDAKPAATKAPGSLPRKEPGNKPAPGATMSAPARGMMAVQPAPKSGSMPGRETAIPKGRLGAEPARKDKLGTPAPVDSKDRPPRPG